MCAQEIDREMKSKSGETDSPNTGQLELKGGVSWKDGDMGVDGHSVVQPELPSLYFPMWLSPSDEPMGQLDNFLS